MAKRNKEPIVAKSQNEYEQTLDILREKNGYDIFGMYYIALYDAKLVILTFNPVSGGYHHWERTVVIARYKTEDEAKEALKSLTKKQKNIIKRPI